jgi:hypothetical protein
MFNGIFSEADKMFAEADEIFESVETKSLLGILLSNQNFEDMESSITLPWKNPQVLAKLREAFKLPADANLIGFKFTLNGIEACLGKSKT